MDLLMRLLIPRARVITPNLLEAAALLDCPVAADEGAMRAQAAQLVARGAQAVLMKGGHGTGAESIDLLVDAASAERFTAPRHPTANTHGTGCTLSAAIAAELAKGAPLAAACREAKAYVTAAIGAADRLKIGAGHGPVPHFHRWW
jgi:hydroxymethylpyrimidine/phosphomethylpyrimidine kinase